MRAILALVWAGTLAAQSTGAGLANRIAAVEADSGLMRHAFWGAQAVNLSTGAVVYAHNADSWFVPASNTKLFSTSMALTRLGPDHRFVTRVAATAAPDAAGVLHGDLHLIGGGDPSLSGREVPYRRNAPMGDPLGPLAALADRLYESGLRRVTGDVVGDDTLYTWEPYPEGWSQDDTVWDYGAPVSALALHDNAVRVQVRPGKSAGAPADIRVFPATGYFTLDAQVETVAGNAERVYLDRAPGSRVLRVWGTVGLRGAGTTELAAIDDPARYAAFALREALLARGIAVDGGASTRHRYPGEALEPSPATVELARRESPPLAQLLQVTDKISQNLHAEMALRAAAGDDSGSQTTRLAALAELRKFLGDAGIAPSEVNLHDGSGLSRLTLASPAAFTRLLAYMAASPLAEQWVSLLPVGGEDGTLSARFRGLSQMRVMAKTGTVTHVSALSGYIDNRRGERIAFSVLVNNANVPAATIRQFIDRIVVMLAE